MLLNKKRPATFISKTILLVGIFVLITITTAAIILTYSSSPDLENNQYYYNVYAIVEQQAQNETKDLSLYNLIQQGSPYLGNPLTAPVTIIDFSDFQC